jgi:hypothetical protein
MIIKLQKKHLDEFKGCEEGACADNMTGPSPITTLEILDRHDINIEVRTAEEAAQIYDAANYGTFRIMTSDWIAERVMRDVLKFEGSYEIYRDYNYEQWKLLGDALKEVGE